MNEPFTIEKLDGPAVRHFSIFLNNKVGALLEIVKRMNERNLIILALSVLDSAESAICRFVVNDPEHAKALFEEDGIPHCMSEVLVTELKEGAADLAHVLTALLKAEVNVHFSYPMLIRPRDRAVLVLRTDDNECASAVLRGDGFPILTQNDLSR